MSGRRRCRTGKSRLLYEFLNWLELLPSRSYLFTGRALANRQGAALGLFRDVIATRFDMHDSDPARPWRRSCGEVRAVPLGGARPRSSATGWGSSSRRARRCSDLLGPQFAATARTHLLEFFASLAATDPVVLALEDLHWADDESLDLLDELTSRLRERSVLVVGVDAAVVARPATRVARPECRSCGSTSPR